jgi:DMSO/TMAO reductase YedYZ molybdopterin-dependent catalytic subunit
VKKDLSTGLLVGFLLAGPLVSILLLFHIAEGTPFIPFDFFDGLVRILPGRLVTTGIDAMVRVLMFLGLSLRSSSKTAEQIQAIAIFVGICALASGIFFATRKQERGTWTSGVVLGMAVAIPMMAFQHLVGSTHEHSLIGAVWTTFALAMWGACASVVRRHLMTGPRLVEAGSRRRFLIELGGATASITVVGAAVAAALRTADNVVQAGSEVELPDRPGAVIPAPGTRPEYTPVGKHYRIDINLMPMKIDGDKWRLPITGLVDRPLSLSLNDFRNFGEPLHQFVTLACISNPVGGDLIGTTQWSGVSVRRVLRSAGVRAQARFLKITSDDGFYETVPLDLINSDERIMFTYLWDGKPLTTEHGFPLRIYIPDRYGMKQPKWITKAELVENDTPGYWVARGWDKTARMKATSVIDTVAVRSPINANGQTLVPIGGIAHAGARGISRVEVKIDDGDWLPARLRTPLSDLTWVLWRYDMPFQPGNHRFTVRCVDGVGQAQIETPQEPHPSGASGLFSTRMAL